MRKSRIFAQVFSGILVLTMLMTMFNFSALAEALDETAVSSEEATPISQEGEVDILASDWANLEDEEGESTDDVAMLNDDVTIDEDENVDEPEDDSSEIPDIDDIINSTDIAYVSSADELEAALLMGGAISVTAEFELDRTFYISQATYIYSDEALTLTRSADFGGDIFVV